ncbi:MAG: hypothetical protein MK116_02130 [Phycisphaerales bacterium]|nr:hypothetical protein [Phycisphaerales bacterium]
MDRLLRAFQAGFGLMALVIGQRGRMRSTYWAWRRETAFGPDGRWPMSRQSRRRAVLSYARWSWLMKRS